jgi:hypothetical protein
MPPKRHGVGDVIFFRSGAHAKWHVEGHVKKVAFFRQTNPFGLGLAVRVLNKAEAHVLRPWRASRWARNRRRLTTFMEEPNAPDRGASEMI